MIIDSSALVAILRGEVDEDRYSRALAETPPASRSISAANFLETAIVIDAAAQPRLSRELDRLFDGEQIAIVPVTESQVRIARAAYRDFGRGSGHPAALNFGDCFAYALATERDEPLLYKGDHFGHTDVRSALE